MTPVEEFNTILKISGPFELKEKGSRFLSYLYPVDNTEKCDEVIAELKKIYYDSTHVCFAYRIGEGVESKFRYSDDGEPSGTAGLPIMNELRGQNIYNALSVVVRYYGGTKLGTGGLARAYRDAAKLATGNSKIIRKKVCYSFRIVLPYDLFNDIVQLANKFSVLISDKKYSSEGIEMSLEIPVTFYDPVRERIINLSKGKIDIPPYF